MDDSPDADSSKPEKGKTESRPVREPLSQLTKVGLLVFGFIAAWLLIAGVEYSRYRLADKRLELDAERSKAEQQIERLRIEKLAAPRTDGISSRVPGAAVEPITGLYILREIIEKSALSPQGLTAADKSKLSVPWLKSLIDVFASVGTLSIQDAKNLKDEIAKAGIDITVEAAKALIHKYIRVHEDEKSLVPPTHIAEAAGGTQVNVYCSVRPPPVIHVPPKKPASHARQCQ